MFGFKDIIESIESLPPLSDAVLEIEKMYAQGSDNVKTTELVKLIESDVMLSIDVLKMANAPVYGFSNRIASVTQAVTLFGIMQIRSFVMHHAIQQSIEARMDVYGISNEHFNDLCNLQSALVTQWYSKIDLKVANQVAPLALVMESGKLILAKEIAQSAYKEQFLQGLKECKNVTNYEKELFDISSYGISALMFEHWNMESLFIDVLHESEKKSGDEELKRYSDILFIIRTALNVREMLTKKSVMRACVLVKAMGLDVDHFVKACVRVKTHYVKELQKREALQ